MVRLTDLSESKDSIIITDNKNCSTSIPLHSIKTIELNEQNRLGFKGIVWNEMNLLLRNFLLAASSCLILFPFLVPDSEWVSWMLVYGLILVASCVFLLSSKRIGYSLSFICTKEKYTLQIQTDKHWQFIYSRFKKHFPFLNNPSSHLLLTPNPRYLIWPILWIIGVIGLLSWSFENCSISGSALFTVFGVFTSTLFLKFNFLSGNTKVSLEENQLVFLENRGRYKNHRHTIDIKRIDRMSMNADHLVRIHRKTQKELAAETGLTNFNHYNRIDYHFLRKNYSLAPHQQSTVHRMQLEALNEWILQGESA